MYMITSNQLFAPFKGIRVTPQYFYDMLLDVLAKIKQYGVCTFFPPCWDAEFEWPHIIQVTASQYGEELSDEQINAIDWDTQCS